MLEQCSPLYHTICYHSIALVPLGTNILQNLTPTVNTHYLTDHSCLTFDNLYSIPSGETTLLRGTDDCSTTRFSPFLFISIISHTWHLDPLISPMTLIILGHSVHLPTFLLSFFPVASLPPPVARVASASSNPRLLKAQQQQHHLRAW